MMTRDERVALPAGEVLDGMLELTRAALRELDAGREPHCGGCAVDLWSWGLATLDDKTLTATITPKGTEVAELMRAREAGGA